LRRAVSALLFVVFSAVVLQGCAGQRPAPSPIEAAGASASRAGAVAYDNGRYPDALESFNEALRLHRGVDDRAGALLDLINVGRVDAILKRHGDAVAALNEAASLATALEDRAALSEVYATMAKVELDAEDTAGAMRYIEKSQEIDRALGLVSGARLNLRAWIYIAAGRYAEAAAMAGRAMDLNQKAHDYTEIANSYRLKGDLSVNDGDLDKALLFYGKARYHDSRYGVPRNLSYDLTRMSLIDARKGDMRGAADFMDRAYTVSLLAGLDRMALSQLDALIILYEDMGDDGMVRRYRTLRERLLTRMPGEKGDEAEGEALP